MFDEVFGEVTFECGYGCSARKEISFFGDTREIEICINAEEDEEITQGQRDAYTALTSDLEEIQSKIARAILEYYNGEEKGAYGPDDPDEFAEWWPDIESEEEMAENLHLDTIIIWSEFHGKNPVYVLFDRDWGGEDLEDNGVSVGIVDGEVMEVGYKDIAL